MGKRWGLKADQQPGMLEGRDERPPLAVQVRPEAALAHGKRRRRRRRRRLRLEIGMRMRMWMWWACLSGTVIGL